MQTQRPTQYGWPPPATSPPRPCPMKNVMLRVQPTVGHMHSPWAWPWCIHLCMNCHWPHAARIWSSSHLAPRLYLLPFLQRIVLLGSPCCLSYLTCTLDASPWQPSTSPSLVALPQQAAPSHSQPYAWQNRLNWPVRWPRPVSSHAVYMDHAAGEPHQSDRYAMMGMP